MQTSFEMKVRLVGGEYITDAFQMLLDKALIGLLSDAGGNITVQSSVDGEHFIDFSTDTFNSGYDEINIVGSVPGRYIRVKSDVLVRVIVNKGEMRLCY